MTNDEIYHNMIVDSQGETEIQYHQNMVTYKFLTEENEFYERINNMGTIELVELMKYVKIVFDGKELDF